MIDFVSSFRQSLSSRDYTRAEKASVEARSRLEGEENNEREKYHVPLCRRKAITSGSERLFCLERFSVDICHVIMTEALFRGDKELGRNLGFTILLGG